MKNLILIIIGCLVLSSCTRNFEEANRNPIQISDSSLTQDFNHIGSYFQGMLSNLFGDQVEENLVQDSYARHLATPTPFVGNINNTTYVITWNTYWNRIYGSVMAPAKQAIQKADAGSYTVFSAWAKLVRILGISRLTAFHGPVIYSQYGAKTAGSVLYDKESDLYDLIFKQLDTIQTVFAANPSYTGLGKFDASYKGDVKLWSKLLNSIRLRLAIRLSKVAPAIAKAQGEKAMSDAAGLIATNSDNFTISLYGRELPIARICFLWDDTRMDAAMESILGGLQDPRAAAYFSPVAEADVALIADHPSFKYKGIRSGAYLVAKGDRTSYSKINNSFNTVLNRRYMTAAEVSFLKAEAALRGWAGAGSAKDNYEAGVKLSFADWGAGGVDTYLANSTNKPWNYVDPKDAKNNFTSRSTVTVAWNEADDNELKLEKIITQKWIDGFTNSMEAWVDHRRTGYPKLPYNAKNDSNETWGIIAANDFTKRMPFVNAERTGNVEGVKDATTKLGGPDMISTRLWWDTGGANF